MVLVVLLSFLLVLAAAVTLVIGLLNGGLGLIYVSIACSLGAGVVLAIAVLRSRPRPAPAFGGPAPLGDEEETLVTPSRTVRRQDEEEDVEPTRSRRSRAVSDGGGPFPIADYDELKVTEILPLLPELEPGELETVREHEAAGKNRSRILGRIEMLAAERSWDGGDEGWEPAADDRPAARTVQRPALGADEDLDGDEDLDEDFEDEFDETFDEFPIADYEELKVGEIMPLLPELDDDELELVRDREEQGQARGMILQRIERLLGGPIAPAPAKAGAAKRRAAKRTSAKKAAARKTTVKKATAKRTATKKAPARKAVAKKTTTKKTAAKKATARRR